LNLTIKPITFTMEDANKEFKMTKFMIEYTYDKNWNIGIIKKWEFLKQIKIILKINNIICIYYIYINI
jgi:hypothetical protein